MIVPDLSERTIRAVVFLALNSGQEPPMEPDRLRLWLIDLANNEIKKIDELMEALDE